MWWLCIGCWAWLGLGDVTVKPLSGPAVPGSLVALTEREVRVQTPNGNQQWNASTLQGVLFSGAEREAGRGGEPGDSLDDSAAAPVVVQLLDGCVLRGNRWTQDGTVGKLEIPPGQSLPVPTRLVRSIHLRPATAESQSQWETIVEGATAGDQLVVRKASEQPADEGPGKVVLDQLEGVIQAITDRHVNFEFDGEKIAVPLEKLEGVVLRNRPTTDWPAASAKVVDRLGGTWLVRSLAWNEGQLQIESVGGLRWEMPAAHLREIDFTAGNLVYLSDLKPETMTWRPFLQTPTTPALLSRWFQMRADRHADGAPFMLQGESFDKGLLLHSRSEVSYRFAAPFRRFQAVAGIDERYRGTGVVQLVISGDDRPLLTREIAGTDLPFLIDVDVQGVRRLKLLVDFGSDRSDSGDHLILGNARFTK